MPLKINAYDLRTLMNVMDVFDAIPEQVKSGTIEFHGGQTFTFRWDENEGPIVTWKEPRK